MAAAFLDPPPRDFTAARGLSKDRIESAIREGRPGSAMKSFTEFLDESAISELAFYVSEAFVDCSGVWPGYHTEANGWPDHRDKYAAAYPYVLGEVPLGAGGQPAGRGADEGRKLYKETCTVCHDPAARVSATSRPADFDDGSVFLVQVASSEEGTDHDAEYATEHDIAPQISGLTSEEARGEALYQANCATCHAADGTGRNWIGSFLRPQPPDFTDPAAFDAADAGALVRTILEGLPQTSMPAFRSALSMEDVTAIVVYLKRAFVPR